MIGTCKICGCAYETTEEDANIPLWCAGPRDRICPTCYRFYYKKQERGAESMNLIEIIREPSVACPETGEAVLLCECERCQHFYGYNTGETKIGCTYHPSGEE
jgi:hypothetical protein